MLRNSYKRFFPIPDFLEMPSFGLDISDESIKYVELLTNKDGIMVGKYGERKIPAGIIESGRIINPQKIEEILIDLRKNEKIKSVRASVPEEQIYLFKINLDKTNLKDIKEAVELSIEEHIPLKAEDVIFDYDILSEDEKSLDIEVVAVSSVVIDSYLSIFQNSGIAVTSFELEAQAIARAVIKKGDKDTYMIVDFGRKRTGIFIVSGGVVTFTSTLDVSSSMLNAMIAKNFKVSLDEAEKMKMKYGLQRNVENKEIFPIILNSISVLRDELVKHSMYWNTHKDEADRKNPLIKKIILCGGGANLIGLADYFAVSMKIEVEIADVWKNITSTKNSVPEIDFSHALSYASALGLALGDFEGAD